MQIRDLFLEVEQATGQERQEAFGRLVRLLAVHETAEEELIHPLARRFLAGGDGLIDDRLAEENQAKDTLARLESLGPGHAEFPAMLAELRASVLRHAHEEETYEFPQLRATKPGQLRSMAAALAAAEKTAPTHPHPGTETAAANLAAGPVLAIFDRVKDAIRKISP
jgi:hemerythrin superfamily protein